MEHRELYFWLFGKKSIFSTFGTQVGTQVAVSVSFVKSDEMYHFLKAWMLCVAIATCHLDK